MAGGDKCEYDSSFDDDASSVGDNIVGGRGVDGADGTDVAAVKHHADPLTGAHHKPSSAQKKRICIDDLTLFNSFARLSAYERHVRLMQEYVLPRTDAAQLMKRDAKRDRRDIDVIRDHHQFIWDDDNSDSADTIGHKLAKKYCDRLYKEYCICDLTFYRQNRIAFRWQTRDEVVRGVGQFICANKKCTAASSLRTWEVAFAYVEQSVSKQALVKVRLCPDCSDRLNYHTKRKELTKKQQRRSQPDKGIEENSETVKRRKTSSAAFPAFGPETPKEDGGRHNSQEANANTTKPGNSAKHNDPMAIWRTRPTGETAEADQENKMDKFIEDLML